MNTEPTTTPQIPLRHDAVTIPCPICQRAFIPAGKRLYCSPACNAAAYRRRKRAANPPVTVPQDRPRRPITVYECDTCATRAVGQQHCHDCGTFMRRIGLGGACPNCDEPITISDLLGEETNH